MKGDLTGPSKVLLFLSSGLRPRYRDDVPRALAMPTGSRMRFRYRRRHLPNGLFQSLSTDTHYGARVLVAYLDASTGGVGPDVIPCRYGLLVETKVVGDIIVVVFELADFTYASNLTEFNRELTSVASELPSWNEGRLGGKFCHLLAQIPQTCSSDNDPATWQAIVKQLKERKDFNEEPFFYTVLGLYNEQKKELLSQADGQYELRPGQTYEFRILHYDPDGTQIPPQTVGESRWIILDVTGEGIQPLTSSMLAIDSPYDSKAFRFRATGNTSKRYARTEFYRLRDPSNHAAKEGAVFDFELLIQTKSVFLRTVAIALLVGTLLATQHMFTLFKSGHLDVTGFIVSVCLGVLTAAVAAFGLKKPA